MSEEINIKCTKCGETTFRFDISLLKLKGEVVCECTTCMATVRVRLGQDEVRIISP
jgi:hypothetical protein